MAPNQLTATAGSSSASQTTTQSPQGATASGFGASQSSGGVQPGTAADLLTSQTGIKLSNTSLPTVNLSPASSATIASTGGASNATGRHHFNASMLGFAVLLIAAAIFLFWTAARSAKNKT